MNLLTAQQTTGLGALVNGLGAPSKVSAQVIGDGAVSATVVVRGRDILNGTWITLATITLSGTNADADSFVMVASYFQVQAELTAVSGTSVRVTAFMGSQ